MLLNKLPPGVCGGEGATGLLNKGGGGGASKQQAVEFPQVLTSLYYYVIFTVLSSVNPQALKCGKILLQVAIDNIFLHTSLN